MSSKIVIISSLIGIVIGILLPSDYLYQIDFLNFTSNPESVIFGSFSSIFIEVISGIVFGILGLIVGLIINYFSEKNSEL